MAKLSGSVVIDNNSFYLNGVCECYNCQKRYAYGYGNRNRVIVRFSKIKSARGAMRVLDEWVCGAISVLPTRVVEYDGKYDEYVDPVWEVSE